jgi:hypothetical protein
MYNSMKNVLSVLLSAEPFFCVFAADAMFGFWAFKDGNPGENVATVQNTSGSGSWTGTGSLGGNDGGTDKTKGVLPTFSSDAPGASIFSSRTGDQLLARNPQSLKFTYDEATSNYGGRVSIEGLSASLSHLDNFTIEYFLKLDPDWHYSSTPAWTWYSKTPLVFQSGGDSAKFICPAGGDAKGISLQCLGPLSVNATKNTGASTSYNDGKWHHAAAVYDRSTQALTFYADYVQVGSFAYTNTPTDASLEFVLGTGLTNKRSTERFRGKISCLRVSSASHVVSDFMRADNVPVATNYDMAAFYDFKDGAAGTDADVVTNRVGDALFSGKAGITWNGTSTVGNKPQFSADRPGKYVYSASVGGELLAADPQSLRFYPGNSSEGGGKLELESLSTALMRADAFTLEFFFKDGTENTYRSMIGYRFGDSVGCKLNLHSSALNSISYEVLTNTSGAVMSSLSSKTYVSSKSGAFHDGDWHHAALVYTASNHMSRMYIDYDSVNSAAVTYTNQFTLTSYPLVLGSSAFPLKAIQEAFGGYLSCFRAMTRALEPKEFLMATDSAVDRTAVFAWNFEEGNSGSVITAAQGYPSLRQNSEVPYVVGDTQPTYSSAVPHSGSRVFWGSKFRNTNNVCAEFWGYQKATELTTARIYAGSTLRQPRATSAAQNPSNWTMEAYAKVRNQQSGWNTGNTGVLLFGKTGNISPQQSPALYPRYCWWLAQQYTGQLKLAWREVNGDEQGLERNAVTAVSCLGDTKWHHLALTYDAALKTFKLYVDATLVLTQTLDHPLWDGPYEYDFARGLDLYGFEGYMDEIRFSNVVLEPSEFVSLVPSPGFLIMFR